jgi:hypothetical protein
MSTPNLPFRELPILKAVSHILGGVKAHWRPMLNLALPWIALITLLNVVAVRAYPSQPSSTPQFNLNWIDYVIFFLNLLATASVAVSWHQFILRDTPLNAVKPYRLDKTVRFYFMRIILINGICFIPLVTLAVLLGLVPSVLWPFIIALLIQLAVFAYRISLCLPAIAIGNLEVGMKESLDVTRGNNLRVLGLLALIYLILAIVLLVFAVAINILELINPTLGSIGVFIFGIPVVFFNMMMAVSLLTSLYGFFIEKREF